MQNIFFQKQLMERRESLIHEEKCLNIRCMTGHRMDEALMSAMNPFFSSSMITFQKISYINDQNTIHFI